MENMIMYCNANFLCNPANGQKDRH